MITEEIQVDTEQVQVTWKLKEMFPHYFIAGLTSLKSEYFTFGSRVPDAQCRFRLELPEDKKISVLQLIKVYFEIESSFLHRVRPTFQFSTQFRKNILTMHVLPVKKLEATQIWEFIGFIDVEGSFYSTNYTIEDLIIKCDVETTTVEVETPEFKRKPMDVFESVEDIGKLLFNETFSDVKLLCDGGEEIPAHKCILAARSPVFRAMFSSDMLECRRNVVRIKNMDCRTMRALLHFIYSARIDQECENSSRAIELLIAADRYGIDRLKQICVEIMCVTITVDNVYQCKEIADLYDIEELNERVAEFVKANEKRIADQRSSSVESVLDLPLFNV